MKKGVTNNPNGRPKGSPNKITAELREFVCDILSENRELIRQDLQVVEPQQRLAFYEKLLQYALPKCANTTIHLNDDDDKKVIKLTLGGGYDGK